MRRIAIALLALLLCGAAPAEGTDMKYDFSAFTRVTLTGIGMENPAVAVDGDMATVTYTSVLTANAYGARGTFRMKGAHYYQRIDGEWIAVNRPD